LAGEEFSEQELLIGMETLGPRPEQPPQQEMDPLLSVGQVTIALPQGKQQFQDHALEDGHIIGKLVGTGQGRQGLGQQGVSGAWLSRIRVAHAYMTLHGALLF
jgi:hypothetical protein